MEKEFPTYIRNMNWKEKLKWKLLIIGAALVGILIVWCAGKAGEKQANAGKEILKEYALRENEWASAGTKFQPEQQAEEEHAQKQQEQTAQEDSQQTQSAAADVQETYGKGPDIKVLLMTSGYQSYFHEQISLKVHGNYELEGAESQQIPDGEILTLDADSPQISDGTLSLKPLEEDSRIELLSIERGQGTPRYRGSLTVYREEKGLRMVNTLPLEEYLCGVVPSEMLASYPEEALKAQAVCARTYASVQMQESKLEDLGAQVDDSVAFQVYQNSPEAESSTKAVENTAGKILLSDGAPICAYYFSTSHGKTSTDEVWEASAPSSYLQSVACSYDAAEPWYKWKVSVAKETVLSNVQKLYPEVKAVEALEIREKGEGDAVLKLAVHTDKGIKECRSEYDIRSLLAPVGATIIRQDGSEARGGTLLPSAYFDLQEQKNTEGVTEGWEISGGGYGHGVGMSQNGAKGMAAQGKNWEEILQYFYKDIEIGNLNQVVK